MAERRAWRDLRVIRTFELVWNYVLGVSGRDDSRAAHVTKKKHRSEHCNLFVIVLMAQTLKGHSHRYRISFGVEESLAVTSSQFSKFLLQISVHLFTLGNQLLVTGHAQAQQRYHDVHRRTRVRSTRIHLWDPFQKILVERADYGTTDRHQEILVGTLNECVHATFPRGLLDQMHTSGALEAITEQRGQISELIISVKLRARNRRSSLIDLFYSNWFHFIYSHINMIKKNDWNN